MADGAIQLLPRRGRELYIVPQNLVEVWVVATRPVSSNGLGMTIERAASELARLKSLFHFLADTPAVHLVWEALVIQHRVSGKPAHDARLVAAMLVHGLTSILTFDREGFGRYAGIEVVHPADVISSSVGPKHEE
jgi:predicted nucleic acid-binding protein